MFGRWEKWKRCPKLEACWGISMFLLWQRSKTGVIWCRTWMGSDWHQGHCKPHWSLRQVSYWHDCQDLTPWVMWIQFVAVQQYPVKEFSIYSIGMFPCSYSLEKLFHFYKVISIHDSDQICVSDLTQSQSQFISQRYLMYNLCFLLMYFPTDHLLQHKIQNGMRLFWALQNIGGQWLSLLNINNCFLFIPISQQIGWKNRIGWVYRL